ncbi:unnamed protein product [Urochloa humidicola]
MRRKTETFLLPPPIHAAVWSAAALCPLLLSTIAPTPLPTPGDLLQQQDPPISVCGLALPLLGASAAVLQ